LHSGNHFFGANLCSAQDAPTNLSHLATPLVVEILFQPLCAAQHSASAGAPGDPLKPWL